jgi:hypothetical protein
MNAHPEVVSVGELINSIGAVSKRSKARKYPCSCGVEIKSCGFWQDVRNRCKEKGIAFDLHDFRTNLDMECGNVVNRFLFGALTRFKFVENARNNVLWDLPGLGHGIKRKIRRNIGIASAALDATGKRFFFDTSKEVTPAFFYAKSLKTGFKVVHLVRDPRGVLNSYIKRRGSDEASSEGIKNWVRVHSSGREIGKVVGASSYHLVKYEDLCNNPAEALKSICRFIGVKPMDLTAVANENIHHVIGNDMRRKALDGIRLDEKWRENLTRFQMDECERLAGQLAKECGYFLGKGDYDSKNG